MSEPLVDHEFEPGVDVDMVAEGRSPSTRWCNVCGEATARHRDPTMLDIVRALSESYTPGGVALALTSRPVHLSRQDSVIELCMTVEGRREVYAWAYSLGEMIAT